jgi:hypothetical protein
MRGRIKGRVYPDMLRRGAVRVQDRLALLCASAAKYDKQAAAKKNGHKPLKPTTAKRLVRITTEVDKLVVDLAREES